MHSRRTWAAAAVVLMMASVSACSNDPVKTSTDASAPSVSASPESAAAITSSIPAGTQDVKVNRSVRLNVADGVFSSVTISSTTGPVEGTLSSDKTSWQSSSRLQPGATYRVRSVAVDDQGRERLYDAKFRTEALPMSKQTYPSFFPQPGSTVGVGMPVIIRFDVPVTDRESIQRHLKVTSKPAQVGGFHWLSSREVHWRPKVYWKPGTKVTVVADIDSVPAGNGVFGQVSRKNNFTIGRSMISKVDMKSYTMKVYEDGKLIRTLPITTGEQPKFTTRSGTKVIIEKFRKKRMNSETVGIPVDSEDGYDLDNVEYAMRLTYSGEFVHAAPWSVGSQGRANVSHGCTGMSTENAGWLYENTIVGDVIEYTGTTKMMTLENGFGDWNLPFSEYAQAAAL